MFIEVLQSRVQLFVSYILILSFFNWEFGLLLLDLFVGFFWLLRDYRLFWLLHLHFSSIPSNTLHRFFNFNFSALLLHEFNEEIVFKGLVALSSIKNVLDFLSLFW
jgi:hypothetical protein